MQGPHGARNGGSLAALSLIALVLVAFLTVHGVQATSGLAIDGSALGNAPAATSQSVTLKTTSSPDVIYLIVVIQSTGATVSSVSDTSSLTWKTRASITTGDIPTYTYYAIASSTLPSDSITVTISPAAYFTVIAFGISGADTSAPFDPNSAVPASSSGSADSAVCNTSPQPSTTISTTGTNDMIIGIVGASNGPVATPGTNYNSINTTSGQVPSAFAEYRLVSSAQSGLTVNACLSINTAWTIIADAVVAPGAIPDLPTGVLLLAIPVIAIYMLVRKRVRGSKGTQGLHGRPAATAPSQVMNRQGPT